MRDFKSASTIEQVRHRMILQCVRGAFQAWCDVVRMQRRHRAVTARVVARITTWRIGDVFSAWVRWWNNRKRLNMLLARSVYNWRMRTQRVVWRKWSIASTESAHLDRGMAKFVALLRMSGLVKAFGVWRAFTQERRAEKDVVAQQQMITDLQAAIAAAEEAAVFTASRLEAEHAAHEEAAEALLASEAAGKAERAAHLVTKAASAEALAAEKAAHARTRDLLRQQDTGAAAAVAEVAKAVELAESTAAAEIQAERAAHQATKEQLGEVAQQKRASAATYADAMDKAQQTIVALQGHLQQEKEARLETEQSLDSTLLELKRQQELEKQLLEDKAAAEKEARRLAARKPHPRWGFRPELVHTPASIYRFTSVPLSLCLSVSLCLCLPLSASVPLLFCASLPPSFSVSPTLCLQGTYAFSGAGSRGSRSSHWTLPWRLRYGCRSRSLSLCVCARACVCACVRVCLCDSLADCLCYNYAQIPEIPRQLH